MRTERCAPPAKSHMERGEDHPTIWLQPPGDPDGRPWCPTDVWSGNPEWDGQLPTEYVRADIVADLREENARLRAALEQIRDHGATQSIARNMPSEDWERKLRIDLQSIAASALAPIIEKDPQS